MANRTIAIGDTHGDLEALTTLLERLPPLDEDDTLVFLGDYLDKGPDPAGVLHYLRVVLPQQTLAKLVCLRGNHEDAWVKVVDDGWLEFVFPPGNGCQATMHSYTGHPAPGERLSGDDLEVLASGSFFPLEDLAWLRKLPFWYEDEHAIYVHAGIPWENGRWLHPSEVDDKQVLLWQRDENFFTRYNAKTPVICGHTPTHLLPQGQSHYTPDDSGDMFWAGGTAYCIDTCAGQDGFLTALMLPDFAVYESR